MDSEDCIWMLRLLMMSIITMAALFDDLRRYKISNKICAAGLLSGIILLICDITMAHGVIGYIAGAAAAFVIMLIAHMVMAVGAGDVKLMGVMGLIVGFKFVNGVILLSFVCTALLGTVLIMCGRCGVKSLAGRKFHTIHFTSALAIAEFIMISACMTGYVEKLC